MKHISNTNNQTDLNTMKDMMQTMFIAQQETNKQLIQILSTITSTLPQPYKPPYTRWISKVYERIDKIAELKQLERKNILNKVYNELQDTYDIDLKDYEYRYIK